MSASKVLGKRNSRQDPQDDSEDEWERKFKEPRTDNTPRRIPQPRHMRGNGGVVQYETTLIQLSDNVVDCTDKIVIYYVDPETHHGNPPDWCYVDLDELQNKIWELMTSALKGNFSVEGDVGNINDFMHDKLRDPKMRKTFLAWLDVAGKFFVDDYENYTPSNPKASFFVFPPENGAEDEDEEEDKAEDKAELSSPRASL